MKTLDDFFAFVYQIVDEFRKREMRMHLDRTQAALDFGSSSLEIMGAVMVVLNECQVEIGTLGFSKELREANILLDVSYGSRARRQRGESVARGKSWAWVSRTLL